MQTEIRPGRSFRLPWVRMLLILSAFTAFGCASDGPTTPPPSSGPPPPPGTSQSLATLQDKYFTPRCAISGCHDTGLMEGGLNLEAGKSYANLVGVVPTTAAAARDGLLRVDPGNPANSLLLLKLRNPPAIYGDRMPAFGGPYLEADEIDEIEEWIAAGAPPDTTAGR